VKDICLALVTSLIMPDNLLFQQTVPVYCVDWDCIAS